MNRKLVFFATTRYPLGAIVTLGKVNVTPAVSCQPFKLMVFVPLLYSSMYWPSEPNTIGSYISSLMTMSPITMVLLFVPGVLVVKA